MGKYLQKAESRIINISSVKKIGIMGDPGCDGLGTYNLKVFSQSLKACEDCDMIMVVGDLVPTGEESYYKIVENLIDTTAKVPVYALAGNHDTGDYEKYLGKMEYTLVSDSTAFIVLNNMKRAFDKEGLSMVSEVLNRDDIKNAYIFFHIPVKNRFSPNSVSEEETKSLREAIGDNLEKVKAIICGHVHSRFEDKIWDIPLICTGGAGAFIEDVSEDIKATQIRHHVYKLNVGSDYELCDLDTEEKSNPYVDEVLTNSLLQCVSNEMLAYLKYMMMADDAKLRGLEGKEKVFRALAASEYHHARNFYSLIEEQDNSLEGFINTENYEYLNLYKMLKEYSSEKGHNLASTAYSSAAAAEKVHSKILEKLKDSDDYSGGTIYVCPVCGYVMETDNVNQRCPVCGRPDREFEEY